MSFSILGTGGAVPERTVSNDEISKWVVTDDEWIYSRTGIKQRHIAKEETATSLAVEAAEKAIESAKIDKNELDMIICATLQGDYITPSQACIIQKNLGLSCPAFDINAACSGFIYALDMASAYFTAKKVKKVLVVAVEVLSRVTNWEDRSTCVLFGDGAGAVVLGEGDGLKTSFVTAAGEIDSLNITYKEGCSPIHPEESERDSFLHMDGKKIFVFAVTTIARDINRCLEESGLKKEQLKWIVPHQANIRIIQSASTKSGIPLERFYTNIDKYANTSCASIPICLDEMARNGLLEKGDHIALIAFGGGLTTGGCVLRW